VVNGKDVFMYPELFCSVGRHLRRSVRWNNILLFLLVIFFKYKFDEVINKESLASL